ncbi:hypothetical protein NIES22_70600 (plasmid) [Calothrix brevissima NIES-22]|nr:hypothetical protein NIES22_70600 [Calothrix brevissima NIES-22]
MYITNDHNGNNGLIHVSKLNPCIHCGKPDWCYSLGELSVCKRDAEPAKGWTRTSKQDRDGSYYYAPVQEKAVRSKAKKDYFYLSRDGQPLVKVARIDDGHGKKSFPQSHWDGQQWVSGNPDEIKRKIPIYRYQEVRKAIAAGELIFIVEGEGVADTLWDLGLAATTFIGGSGKYRSYGTGYKEDLAGASVVICPDRDEPGLKHADDIAQDFPNAQWLYAPPNPFFWEHLPKSGGLDIGDWVKDGAKATDIIEQVGDKKYQQASDLVPLIAYLSESDRRLIEHGTLKGTASASDELARNLIGIEARLLEIGENFTGDSRELFDQFNARSKTPLDSKTADQIWWTQKSFSPRSTLSYEELKKRGQWWRDRGTYATQQDLLLGTNVKSVQNESSKVIVHPAVARQTLNGDELLKEINSIFEANLGQSRLEASLLDLAARTGRTSNELWRLYKAREQEDSQMGDREIATKQLPSLLEARKASLTPEQILWGDGGKLAHLIQFTADNMPISPEVLLTTLFPVAGSRIGTSSRLVIKPSTGYTATSIFWSCVVSMTGTLKSPSQQVIIDSLNDFEDDEYQNWKLATDDYKRQMKQRGKGDDLPDEPSPRKRFIIKGSTSEARMKIHGENPRGLLYYRDEWSGFITGRNKYRGGKGDDAQLDLSEFNGEALFKDGVDSEKCIFLKRSAISRTGNTQPDTLKDLQSQGNFEDHTGEFARWLFCLKDNPLPYINLSSDTDEDDKLGNLLKSALGFLYKELGRLPERDYFLSNDAKKIYETYQHQLMDWLKVEENPGLAATYPKLQTYLGRFALWLHLVNAVLAGETTPRQFVDGHTMAVSCHIVDFYLAQARLLYAINSQQQELAGNLLKIKEYIEKRPQGVKLRDIKRGIRAIKDLPNSEIEQDLNTLVSTGVITQVSKVYYPMSVKNVNTGDKVGTVCHHPKSYTDIEVQDFVNSGNKFLSNFEKQTSLDGYQTSNREILSIVQSVPTVDNLDESLTQQASPLLTTCPQSVPTVDVCYGVSNELSNSGNTPLAEQSNDSRNDHCVNEPIPQSPMPLTEVDPDEYIGQTCEKRGLRTTQSGILADIDNHNWIAKIELPDGTTIAANYNECFVLARGGQK